MRVGPRSVPAFLLFALALGVPALCSLAEAQPATSTYNTTCDKKPSESDENAARAYFTIGKKAYDEADYTKAIDNLKDAYKLDCTKPILLNYVASAYIAKGDKAEAVAALEAFMKRDPKAAESEGVPKKIANLKAALATANTTATTTTTATGTTTSTAPTSTATATTTSTENPPPPGGEERHHTAFPWIVVGVGGAALVGGVVLLALGTKKVGDSFATCPNGVCKNPADIAGSMQQNSEGRGLQNAGIVVALVGVAAVGGGLLWHFLEPTGPAKSAFIRPDLGPGYAGISGTF